MSIDKKDFERLMNLARTKLPGASDAGMKMELFDVINEFLADSNSWTENLDVPVVASTQDYDLEPQNGGLILRLVAVFDKNRVGLPSVLSELHPPGAKLHLVWPQNTSFTAKAVVIKNIILPTTRDEVPNAPTWLLPVYERVIIDGLLGKMMGQQTKSYTNGTLSAFHLQKFRSGIVTARVAAERANIYGGQSWRFPSTFRTQSQRGGVSTPFPSSTSW